ncbi:uncharacterized protein LOC131074824 isoform X2 [Cryptomeria japonica]|uniref:uncharacterized protein LOC131074824 isoform X2 n=1 Tax=Cryptomeria japonica TaxID=3369 RepID=UPI0025AD4F09|nr:uncharacterized protein LOC131074824 isoform X2 [Cryptomeria japonica]
MVRVVIGDETHLNSVETHLSQSAISVQVGLAIGKLGGAKSNRNSVFALIPTPPNDGVDPTSLISENAESSRSGRVDKKKVSKGKSMADSSSLIIDVEWVGEHARQVSKMLVGGLHIVGIYVWAAENVFKNSSLMLWQAVQAIAGAAPVYADGEVDERILVHISYSPRRWSCRSCNLDSNFTSMSFRPCDLKMTKLLSTLQSFRSTYSFEVSDSFGLNVTSEEDMQKTNHMKKVLLKAIALLAEQLKSAKASLDGNLINEDKVSIPGGPHEINFLLPFADVKSMHVGSSEEVVGLVVFSGTIFAQAYAFPRESLLQAVEDLKGDIITSLKSRLEILSDDAEEASTSLKSEEVNLHEDKSLLKQGDTLFSCNWSKECSFVFPRRVLVPWLDDIFICDYLQGKETFQDLHERCQELMSMKSLLDHSKILEPEESGSASIGMSFWGMTGGNSSSTCTKRNDDPGKTGKESRVVTFGSFHGAVALIIVVLAILIALIMLATGWR